MPGREHDTVAQNRAHRNDMAWVASSGRSFDADGEHYIREYVNPWTGQAIRKSWRMTGHDWHIFGPDGKRYAFPRDRAHSLTWAKHQAANAVTEAAERADVAEVTPLHRD